LKYNFDISKKITKFQRSIELFSIKRIYLHYIYKHLPFDLDMLRNQR